jgi:peroxiredoxin
MEDTSPAPPGGDRPVTPAGDSAATGTTTLPADDRPPAERGLVIPRGLLWALALAVVVLCIAGWMALSASQPDPGTAGGDPTPVSPTDLVGHAAPDARYDVLDGTPSSLADLRGSPVVVNFWSATCVPCISEMPAFEEVHQSYGDKVRFIGLAVADNESAARSQRRRTGVTYPLGFDPEGAIAKSFGVVTIPATVLIDRDGIVRHVNQGPALTAPSLSSLITGSLRP